MDLEPITRASASDAVYDRLVASIVDGEVAAGDALPSERGLAEALGVSRPVVREALQRLAHAGLLRIRHGGATRVADYRRSAGPALLADLLTDRAGELDLTVARSIVEVRADLAPPVASAAARRRTATHLETMDDLLDGLRAADTLAERQRRSLDLWDVVVDASGNVAYRLLFNALRTAYEPVMDALAVVVRDEVSDVEGHATVVAAIRARDVAAAADAGGALVGRGTAATIAAIAAMTDPDPTTEERP